ncbi:fatty acid desaturase [Ilumatobacter sp.]|uniref:fatty acid desaturase n=1 Tax=Ilumatobacter sp. TaxID=1967498 RepID=UPI0037520657
MRTVLLGGGVGLGLTLVANLCTTVYLHRALAHRAVTIAAPVAHVFRFVLWLSTGICPRQWVAVHRKHHAFTDVEGDPHSPVLHGWVKVQIQNYFMYRREANNPDTVARYAKDMPPTRLDRWAYDRPLLGLGLGIAITVNAFGWQVGLLASFLHLNFYIGGSAAVNAIGHHFGRRPYNNGAGNLQWLAFLTAGEGLHNNHHAAPTSARLSHRWFEIDPGWWLIKVLSWVGLAKIRLSELKLAADQLRTKAQQPA